MVKKLLAVMFVATLSILAAGNASADTIFSDHDVSTYSGTPNVNYNDYNGGDADSELWAGLFSGTNTRTYFKFDLSDYSSVQSAYLYMYADDYNTGSSTINSYSTSSYYKNSASLWTETGLTWANQPDLGTAGGSTLVGAGNGWYAWDVTSLAQGASGDMFSLALASSGAMKIFYADETDSVAFRPYLSVTAVPEPISTALFVLGGATLAVRRIRKAKKS